jgi:hypothetical protein
MLSPLCDCLTLLWKGKMNPGTILVVPVPHDFETPIHGWEPRPPDYWKEGARVYGTVLPPVNRMDLPYSIVKFYMEEARDLAAAGRLVLVPGPMVGCLGVGYKDTEDMFCKVAAAEPIIRLGSSNSERLPLEMVVPWFPSIPLGDLAKLCDDHSECLIELRQKCLEWSDGVQNNKERVLARIRTEISLLSRDVERAFRRASGTAEAGSQLNLEKTKGFGGQAKKDEIHSSPIRCESNNRMRAFLGDDLCEHIWFPYWSFEQRGLKMELGSSLHPGNAGGDVPRGAIVNGDVFHWLKAPGEFSSCFMVYPKDEEFHEALSRGHLKTYEVKGGRIAEVRTEDTAKKAMAEAVHVALVEVVPAEGYVPGKKPSEPVILVKTRTATPSDVDSAKEQ